jgi:hypothetical protein
VTALARVFVPTLRTVAPYRLGLLAPVLVIMAVFSGKPEFMVPALVFVTMSAAVLPFYISDRNGRAALAGCSGLTRAAGSSMRPPCVQTLDRSGFFGGFSGWQSLHPARSGRARR